MGEVYLARDTRLDREAALKLLPLSSPKTKIVCDASFKKRRLPQRSIIRT